MVCVCVWCDVWVWCGGCGVMGVVWCVCVFVYMCVVWCVCVVCVLWFFPFTAGRGVGNEAGQPFILHPSGAGSGAPLSLAPRASLQAGLRGCWRSPGLGSTQLICQDFYTIVFGCSRALSSLIFCSLDTSFPFRLPGVSRKAGGVLFQVSKSLSTNKKWQTSQLPPHQHPPPGL